MLFDNPEVDIALLPNANTVELKPIMPDYKKVMYFGHIIFYLITFIIITLLLIFAFDETSEKNIAYIMYAVWFVLFLISVFLVNKQFKVKAFGLRQRDIMYRTGLIWRKTTTIPFNRIQHSEIKEGPLSKWFGLCTLNVYTAGGAQSDMKIPGLLKAEGVRIKDYITGQTIAYDEEE